MHPRLSLVILATVILPAVFAAAQAPEANGLIEKAIAVSKDTSAKTRYTYFVLSHDENSYKQRTFFGKRRIFDRTTLYEYTWIGERPYGRVVEVDGKPLTGDALKEEQRRYDQAVAEHARLGVEERARIDRLSLIDTSLKLETLLSAAYRVTRIGQETMDGAVTQHIECVPASSGSAGLPAATRHVDLWITDSGQIMRESYVVVADEQTLQRGSHFQLDFQVIHGDVVPLHQVDEVFLFSAARNAVVAVTGENTFSRFRKFNVSSRLIPGDGTSPPTSPN